MNRLASEKSPYLLQHAKNPVDWYPWGAEAFARARDEGKPIFLSVGYSTCHWCHVMAHESFEDAGVAVLLNDTFVPIKVDREERPDIDAQYMRVCQMMTGSGGWPLTIFMTPDKEPFFAATYIPRESRFGRAGLVDLARSVKEIWHSRKEEVVASAKQITDAMRQAVEPVQGPALEEADLHTCFREMADAFDEVWGGFGTAPKFPSPHNLVFLLRYWKRTGESKALQMVETTLQAMSRGGIQDHLGSGFHRYSTDRQWLVPHFEKMIYDQALLSAAFLEAYEATRKEEYAVTARSILDYVLRDMTSQEGGFFTAEDADSEGEEGKFYLWTSAEIGDLLGKDADAVKAAFGVKDEGNFAPEIGGGAGGLNILHTRSLEETALTIGMPVAELSRRVEAAKRTLLERRSKRVRPGKDDKILADWNGLMAASMAKAGRVLGEPRYVQAAERCLSFVFSHMMTPESRLLHRFRDGEAFASGNLDDYSFMVHGLLETYEARFDTAYLKRALVLNRQMIEHFWDADGGGFFLSADDAEKMILRQKETYDGAIPSGNSLAMLDLLRLSMITGESSLEEKAAALSQAFSEGVRRFPSAHAQLMSAVDMALGPSHSIVVVGKPGALDTGAMLNAVRSAYLPNTFVVLLREGDHDQDMTQIAPFTRSMSMVAGRAAAYVCSKDACNAPTTDPAELTRQLA